MLVALLKAVVGLALSVGVPHANGGVTHSVHEAAFVRAASVRVPVLMYHYIRVNPNPRDREGADLSVTPASFLQEMQLLSSAGYHTVTLDDLVAAMDYGAPLPLRPIIISFDDGYADLYTAAFPVLQRFNFKATSFIITGKVGWGGYLNWDQIREMQASGLLEFESHTVHHPDMKQISLATAQAELVQSKSTLEKQLGRPVLFFCYPSGHYNGAEVALVRKDGYVAAVTTQYGTVHSASDQWTLTRVRIHGGEGLSVFSASIGIASASSR